MLLSTCKAVAFFDHKGSWYVSVPAVSLPSPGFWLAVVLFTRLRTVGLSQINCIPMLYNHAFQADRFCFMPGWSFRVGVMDVHSIQTGIFKNPLSR